MEEYNKATSLQGWIVRMKNQLMNKWTNINAAPKIFLLLLPRMLSNRGNKTNDEQLLDATLLMSSTCEKNTTFICRKL